MGEDIPRKWEPKESRDGHTYIGQDGFQSKSVTRDNEGHGIMKRDQFLKKMCLAACPVVEAVSGSCSETREKTQRWHTDTRVYWKLLTESVQCWPAAWRCAPAPAPAIMNREGVPYLGRGTKGHMLAKRDCPCMATFQGAVAHVEGLCAPSEHDVH